MTTDDLPVSRREVDQLRDELHRIDDHGSRGVGTIQVQLTEIVKDVTELKTEINSRFEAHQRIHDQDHAERVNGRRWLITTGIAGLMAMLTVVGLLVEILLKLKP